MDLNWSSSDEQENSPQNEYKKPSSWTNLPENLLEKIFSNLNYRDRVSASLVCRQWSTAFHAPDLWRFMYVQLTSGPASRDIERAIAFLDRYGQYLWHLKITYDRYTEIMSHPHMSRFLSKLSSKTEIRTFAMRKYYFTEPWNLLSEPTIFMAQIEQFLATQRSIMRINFSKTYLSMKDGISLLRGLCVLSGENLKILDLVDSFRPADEVYRNSDFLTLLSRLVSLQIIRLNHCYLSEEVFRVLSETCNNLRIMSLYFREGDLLVQVPGKAWNLLMSANPELTVHFTLDDTMESIDPCVMLPKEMPLKKLNYKYCHLPEEFSWPHTANALISHIERGFRNTLTSVTMRIRQKVPDIKESITNLAVNCPKLIILNIEGDLPVSLVEVLCAAKFNNLTGLEHLHVLFQNLTFQGIEQLEDLIRRLQPTLEERSLDFTFRWHR